MEIPCRHWKEVPFFTTSSVISVVWKIRPSQPFLGPNFEVIQLLFAQMILVVANLFSIIFS